MTPTTTATPPEKTGPSQISTGNGDVMQPQSTPQPRDTSCTSTCANCHGTGAIALHACDRRTQWLRRVGYPDLFGRWAA